MTTPNNDILNVFKRTDLIASEKIVFLTMQLAGDDLTQDQIAKLAGTTRLTVARAMKVLRIREAQLAMSAVAGR